VADLLKFRKNVTSQHGEDGIIERIFHVIGKGSWCVEFGAWDGKHLSNTWNLLVKKGWSGVLIEPDPKKYVELQSRYKKYPRVYALREFVGLSGPTRLDALLRKTPIPKDFDLLSIDIDGAEYHVWDSLRAYTPKVVVVEYNPSMPDDLAYVQAPDISVRQGSSLLALTRLAKRKGYELVCTTETNGIYVHKKYFPLFGIADNSVTALHWDRSHLTSLFQFYDGTLMLHGCDRLLWHGVKIDPSRIQVLPRPLRKFGNWTADRVIGVLKHVRYYRRDWGSRKR